jgi:hypothetical protein
MLLSFRPTYPQNLSTDERRAKIVQRQILIASLPREENSSNLLLNGDDYPHHPRRHGKKMLESVINRPALHLFCIQVKSSLALEVYDILLRLTYLGMDMTTAIVSCFPSVPSSPQSERSLSSVLAPTENLDMVPSFYAYSVKSCLLPIRKVQDQLVAHYFFHVHPMFPLVDEAYFTKLHQAYRGQEELMDKTDFMVYYAIMVAGFAVSTLLFDYTSNCS